MPGVAGEAAKVADVKVTAETRPVETRPIEPVKAGGVEVPRPPAVEARAAVAPPEAVLAGEKVPRTIGPVEAAGRRVGGTFVDTFITAVKSRPVQVVASFGVAFVAAGLVLYLAPKFLTLALKAAGASDTQIQWIYWALAIIIGVVVFYLAWRFLIKPSGLVGKK